MCVFHTHTAEQHPPVGKSFTCCSGNSIKAQFLISDLTLLLFLHGGDKPSRHMTHILTMTPYLHLCLILAYLWGALIGLVNTATNWQAVHHLTRCYYSSISDKKDKVLLEFVYLPRPQLCPSVRGEWMMCLADWVEMTFLDLCWLTFLHLPERQTETEGRGTSNDGWGSLRGVAHGYGPVSASSPFWPERSGVASADVSTLWLSSCASRGKQLSLFPSTAQFGFVHVCFPNHFSSGGTIYIPLKLFTFHLLPMTYYFCVPCKLPPNVQGEWIIADLYSYLLEK